MPKQISVAFFSRARPRARPWLRPWHGRNHGHGHGLGNQGHGYETAHLLISIYLAVKIIFGTKVLNFSSRIWSTFGLD